MGEPKKLRVAIPSEGVRVALCSELQKATFDKFPKFAFTFIISCMNADHRFIICRFRRDPNSTVIYQTTRFKSSVNPNITSDHIQSAWAKEKNEQDQKRAAMLKTALTASRMR